MNPNPLSIRSRAIVPVGIPQALRSESPGTSPGDSAGYGRLRGKRAVGTRAGRVVQPQLSWKIGASLGSSALEVKLKPAFRGNAGSRDLPGFRIVVLVFFIVVVFVV